MKFFVCLFVCFGNICVCIYTEVIGAQKWMHTLKTLKMEYFIPESAVVISHIFEARFL